MVGRNLARPNVDSKLAELSTRLDDGLLLAKDAANFHEIRGGHLCPIRHSRIYQINEMAFLSMFLAWEDFLEESFTRYMCGAVTRTHYCPKVYVSPINLDHALKFFIVRPRDYVEWSSAQQVIERAEMVFRDGEPYKSALRPLLTDLDDMRQIRNSIAHRSGTSWKRFETLVRKILGSRPYRLTPGLFLSLTHAVVGKPYIEHYKDVLLVAATRIVR